MNILRMAFGAAIVSVMLAGTGTALAADRNHDGIPDAWEKRHGLSLKKDQARRDQDRDELRNLDEYRQRTDPRDADTDSDGLEDGDEVHSGHDPQDDDSDDDGISDGLEITGEIRSFDATTGALVIDTVSGQLEGPVTELTRITCDDDGTGAHGRSDDDNGGDDDGGQEDGGGHHGDDGSGDDSGDDGTGDDSGGGSGGDRVCTTADLVPGAAVHEAELEHGTWTKVELAR